MRHSVVGFMPIFGTQSLSCFFLWEKWTLVSEILQKRFQANTFCSTFFLWVSLGSLSYKVIKMFSTKLCGTVQYSDKPWSCILSSFPLPNKEYCTDFVYPSCKGTKRTKLECMRGASKGAKPVLGRNDSGKTSNCDFSNQWCICNLNCYYFP